MNRHAEAAARYKSGTSSALRNSAVAVTAVAGSGDLPAGRDVLIQAASTVLGVVTAEDISKGRAPEASTLIVAIQGIASHERSLKPPARQVLAELRRLLSEVKD